MSGRFLALASSMTSNRKIVRCRGDVEIVPCRSLTSTKNCGSKLTSASCRTVFKVNETSPITFESDIHGRRAPSQGADHSLPKQSRALTRRGGGHDLLEAVDNIVQGGDI